MNRSIEAIPTWALCYIINGDASGLTDEEIRMVDEAIRKNNIEIVSPRYNEDMCTEPYFSRYPFSDCLQKLRTATSSIMSNNPFNNIRYEHYRIFQENHTSLFGGACNGGQTLCSQV